MHLHIYQHTLSISHSPSPSPSNPPLALPLRRFKGMSTTRPIDKIDLFFLGTMSGAPPAGCRNQTCIGLRLDSNIWLFDCGDGAQGQIQRSMLSAANITRIFITHLHGDHCFGLPGMLCNISVSSAGKAQREPLVIVGPVGLRDLIRVTLGTTYCRLGNWRYTVHELADVPAPEGLLHTYTAQPNVLHANELEGLMVHPTAAGEWIIPSIPGDQGIEIRACALPHTVPTVGFAITEAQRPGKLDIARASPMLKQHSLPPSVLGRLKAGEKIPLPDGSMLDPADFVAPAPPKRKVVILGDTYGGVAAKSIGLDCDVLVHEATNACLQEDICDTCNPATVQESAIAHGHSTPQMAAQAAVAMGAHNLVLTHFSPRYKGDTSDKSKAIMQEICALAESIAHRPVFAAVDFQSFNIPIGGGILTVGSVATKSASESIISNASTEST